MDSTTDLPDGAVEKSGGDIEFTVRMRRSNFEALLARKPGSDPIRITPCRAEGMPVFRFKFALDIHPGETVPKEVIEAEGSDG